MLGMRKELVRYVIPQPLIIMHEDAIDDHSHATQQHIPSRVNPRISLDGRRDCGEMNFQDDIPQDIGPSRNVDRVCRPPNESVGERFVDNVECESRRPFPWRHRKEICAAWAVQILVLRASRRYLDKRADPGSGHLLLLCRGFFSTNLSTNVDLNRNIFSAIFDQLKIRPKFLVPRMHQRNQRFGVK